MRLFIVTLVCCMLLLCTFQPLFAQLWYTTRGLTGEDRAWAVATDAEGNIYWAVEQKDQFPYWYYNIVLYKIEPSTGQTIWQSPSWGGAFNDIAFVAKVSGNRVYLGGRQDSTALPNTGDALLLCYQTETGSLNWHNVWSRGFGYEEIDGLAIEPDGIYLSGWTEGQTTDMDFLIGKTDLNGQNSWHNWWDYENLARFDGANGHLALDDQYIYAAGHVNRANIGSLDGDMGLVCFSRQDGGYQWHVTWGGWLYDDALGLTISADSMLYVVGYTGSYGNGSQNYLNKYTRTGQLLWSRLWGGTGAEDARAVVADADSVVYVAGATSSYGNGDYDIFVLKYSGEGILLDSLIWGGAYKETAHDAVLHGNYLYITGETGSFGNGYATGNHQADGLLLKINAHTLQAPDSTMTAVEQPPVSPFTESGNWLQVYPNPAQGAVWVRYLPNITGSVAVTVYNTSGKLCKSVSLLSAEQPVLLGLPKGLYFYRAINAAGQAASGKIVVW
ncbi:T9SS C-terminal target domain-containing protein [Sphingobacteriales bacterium UPWRP_1]|nr:hypothetical protein BVG80_11755 [Sphingobacteriales bacterium TSM_CSM]PSJ77902.1 T9SS C-terminal target domain-containing protein [Sphingobacteriales bacterium UPWRP_1]